MEKFVFTQYAEKQWKNLDPMTQKKIIKQLETIKNDRKKFEIKLKPLVNLSPATHRLRLGDFRMILVCDVVFGEHLVLKVGHRKDIYS